MDHNAWVRKSYYISNFHNTVHLTCVLHVCVKVSHNVPYQSTWNFYSVPSYSKLSSPVNLVSFHSFVVMYEFTETYFWDDPRRKKFLKIEYTYNENCILEIFFPNWKAAARYVEPHTGNDCFTLESKQVNTQGSDNLSDRKLASILSNFSQRQFELNYQAWVELLRKIVCKICRGNFSSNLK